MKYGSVLSEFKSLTTGVPQGSCLAPKMFIIYLNNMLDSINTCSTIAYADNVTIVNVGHTAAASASSAESTVVDILTWANNNGLVLNFAKCQTMIIPPVSRKKLSLLIDLNVSSVNAIIKASCILRVVSVIFTTDLKWEVHSSCIRKSFNNMINNYLCSLMSVYEHRYAMSPCFRFCSAEGFFCLAVWSSVNKAEANAMNHTLGRATRIILQNTKSNLT